MYTIKDIQKLGPCKEYTEERLKELWAGRESLSRREILKLDIPIDDKNWVVPQLVSTEVVVTWAQYCADEAEKHTGSNAAVSAASSNAADAARSARSAGYAHAAAANTRYVPRYAAVNVGSAANAGYAKYAAVGYVEYAAADARAAARAAGYAAKSAGYAAWSATLSAWDKTREKELYRLLTVLCDMEEKSK